MTIFHIYKDYFPVLGGIENHVRVPAKAGVVRGHEVTGLVTSPDRSHLSPRERMAAAA